MSAFSNARWAGAIQGARIGGQVLSLLVLSRLLSPADFGLAAMALVITNFATLIRDLGTGAAIIQSPNLQEETTLTAHWTNCFVGLGLGVLLYVLAFPIAVFFKAPDVQSLVQLLALTFPILGATTVHQALLERESRFATLARIEIAAVSCGVLAAIAAAWHGAGAFSLVIQTLTVAVVSAAQLWRASPLQVHWLWRRKRAGELWRFGGHLLGFNLVNYFSRNVDALIIGRVLGPTSLGPYSVAYRLMLFPLQNLTFVATRALFPVMSRSQHSTPQLGEMYLRLLSVIAFFTAPLMAGLFVLRDTFVSVALGESWGMVATLTAWLAPIGFIQSLVSAGGTVFMALGRTDALFRLGVFSTVLHVIAFASGVRWGVVGVAAAYLLASGINSVVCFRILMRMLERNPLSLIAAVCPAVIRALIMALALRFAQQELAAHSVPQLVQLVALSIAGALIYLALARAHVQPSDRDVLRLFARRA